MGCWTGTCGLSYLPIEMSGCRVRGFVFYSRGRDEALLRRKPDPWDRNNFSGSCYPTDVNMPVELPVSGVYDSYGSIEDINDDIGLRAVSGQFGVDENYQSVYDGGSRSKTPFLSFLTDVERGCKRVQDPLYDATVGVGLFMVREDVYLSFRDTPTYQKVKQSGEAYFRKLDKENLKRREPIDYDELKRLMGDSGPDLEVLRGLTLDSLPVSDGPFYDAFLSQYPSGVFRIPSNGVVRSYIEDLYIDEGKTSADPEVQKLIDDLALSAAFMRYAFRTGQTFDPPAGKGGQDLEWDDPIRFARKIIEVGTAAKEAYERDCDY